MPRTMTPSQHREYVAARAKPMRKLPAPLEKDVQATIRDFLKLAGFFVMRHNSGAIVSTYKGRKRVIRMTDRTGLSDLFFAKGPVWGYCEVKRPGASGATLPQQAFLADVRRHGGVGIVATGIEDVREALGL